MSFTAKGALFINASEEAALMRCFVRRKIVGICRWIHIPTH
ncbi:MAG: hypothetical protein ACTS8H_02295 [Arsenophonus sp. NC-PE1-MAG3]